MTNDERTRYLAAFEAAWPGDLRGRGDEEQWEIAEWMRSVETADSVGLAARHLYDGGYAEATPEEPDRCVRYARIIRAALGIVDPPEPASLEERLATVEKERDRLRDELTSARLRGMNEERERIIGAVEEAIGRPIADGGQYRADIKSAISAAMAERTATVERERDALADTLARVRDVLTRYAPDPDSSEAFLLADIREALGEEVEPYWTDDGREPRLGLRVWQTARGWVYSTGNVPSGDRAFDAWLAARPTFATEQEAKDAAVAAAKEEE